MEDIASENVPLPKIPYDYWIRYQQETLSYPGIRKDSLRRNLLTQVTLSSSDFFGKDRSQKSLPTQELEEIVLQHNQPPGKSKKYWAAQ